jgi:CRP/FNR family cyclic AMP-dependent transcriptional regulator
MQALPLTFEADSTLAKGVVNPCVNRFLEHCHRRKYPNKSVIIYAGDQPDVLYYIINGSVSVLIEDENGHEIVLAYINAGGFFGEMGLFGEQPNRSAWIRTRSECEVAEISYARFRALAKEDPDILLELTAQLATRLRKTSRKVGNLAFLDVTGRIAHTLLELCKEPDANGRPGT